jgi:hypothetical protein
MVISRPGRGEAIYCPCCIAPWRLESGAEAAVALRWIDAQEADGIDGRKNIAKVR